MVNVTDRAHVDVGLAAFKLFFCHGDNSSLTKMMD
jgi:hypothetical protein